MVRKSWIIGATISRFSREAGIPKPSTLNPKPLPRLVIYKETWSKKNKGKRAPLGYQSILQGLQVRMRLVAVASVLLHSPAAHAHARVDPGGQQELRSCYPWMAPKN